MSTPDRPTASGLSPLLAGGIVLGVLGLSAVLGRRNAPDPSHPTIRRWYKRLDKPDFTPPDAVFGAVWPVLETGLVWRRGDDAPTLAGLRRLALGE